MRFAKEINTKIYYILFVFLFIKFPSFQIMLNFNILSDYIFIIIPSTLITYNDKYENFICTIKIPYQKILSSAAKIRMEKFIN